MDIEVSELQNREESISKIWGYIILNLLISLRANRAGQG